MERYRQLARNEEAFKALMSILDLLFMVDCISNDVWVKSHELKWKFLEIELK